MTARTGFRKQQRAVIGLLLAAMAASCAARDRPAALPPRPAMLPVTLSEYRFEHAPEVPAGRTVFEIRNNGKVDHQVLLVRLPDDLPGTLDQQLHSPNRRPVDTITVMGGLGPGRSRAMAADLAPGRYGLLCFLRDGEMPHALKGMNSELRVK